VLDDLKFDGFKCAFCHQIGTVVREWPETNHTCPRCGKVTVYRPRVAQ
jgi:predicted RNA-binding Zn-ribbon protein involved in translation (DUF1610 family)